MIDQTWEMRQYILSLVKNMKLNNLLSKMLAACGTCVLLTACVPYFDAFHHVFIKTGLGVAATEWRKVSEELVFRKDEKIPVEYMLERKGYSIRIRTPYVGNHLYIQLKLVGADTKSLRLRSELLAYNPELKDYVFYLERHPDIRLIPVEVLKNGAVLDEEEIQFEVTKLGYVYSVDAL